jgi:signal transduction histidine kinase
LSPPVTALFVLSLNLAAYFVGRSAAQVFHLSIATLETSWREQQQARERLEARATNAAANTRLEISRELHDILAHSLSLIVVQANGARLSVEEHPEVAEQTLGRIAEVASEALTEIRATIGGLRLQGLRSLKSEELLPQPGLDDIQNLIDALAGRATLREIGTAPSTSVMLSLTAYRVVQESLTNFRKHAPDSSCVVVTLNYSPELIEIDIINDGGGELAESEATLEAPEPSTGSGLFGMAERVIAVGGQFEAGLLLDGGFRVHAWIPVTSSDDGQPTDIQTAY